MHVIVIGAGVAGATTAWYLQTAGIQVSLLDSAVQPACGASAANGGMLHASHAEPWNSPGVVWSLLRYAVQRDAPLILRARALPGLLPWGVEFLWNSRRRAFHAHTLHNAALAQYALAEMRQLQQQLNLDFDYSETGIVKLFRDPASLTEHQATHPALLELGIATESWDTERLIAEEPTLYPVRGQLAGAVRFPGDATGNAAQFTRALVTQAQQAGMHWQPNTPVTSLRLHRGRINGVNTPQGPWAADAVVLANGFAAPTLLRPLGLRLPVAPVKGYSLTLAMPPDRRPRWPLIDDTHKIVITPLGEHLRLAGTAEFAGADTRLDLSRAAQVLRQCRRTLVSLPLSLEAARMQPWTGLRPMSARGTPILGPMPIPGLYIHSGGGHLGWTLACGGAALVRDSLLGRPTALPLEPFLFR